jgi:hypothetical protein
MMWRDWLELAMVLALCLLTLWDLFWKAVNDDDEDGDCE